MYILYKYCYIILYITVIKLSNKCIKIKKTKKMCNCLLFRKKLNKNRS